MTTAELASFEVSEPSALGVEIHSRSADGVTVTLYADIQISETVISCEVESALESFIIRDIPHDRVMEVFNHPYSVGIKLLEKGSL